MLPCSREDMFPSMQEYSMISTLGVSTNTRSLVIGRVYVLGSSSTHLNSICPKSGRLNVIVSFDWSLIGWPSVSSLVHPFMLMASITSVSPSHLPRESPNQVGGQSFRCGSPSVLTTWNIVLCSNKKATHSWLWMICIGCGWNERIQPNGMQLPAKSPFLTGL